MGQSTGTIWDTLAAAGLLPKGQRLSQPEFSDDRFRDLLPVLIQAWSAARNAAAKPAERHRAQRQVDKFTRGHATGACLTLGIPDLAPAAPAGWLGQRLAWWPRGIPPGRRVGLASSRLGRAADGQKAWFTVLRAACAKIDPRRDLVLTATSTTTARYVQRCATLFGLRVLKIEAPENDTIPLDKWVDGTETRQQSHADSPLDAVFLSPPLGRTAATENEAVGTVPVRDRAVVALSDRLLVFRVRRDGHLHRLLRARLCDSTWPLASVYVALGPRLVRSEMADELMDLGAVGWVVLDALDDSAGSAALPTAASPPAQSETDASRLSTACSPLPTAHPPSRARIVPLPPAENWPFLTHCTRRREGPWPDQVDADYLDDLILDREDANHSAIAALGRIVGQQRLIATAQTIRGSTPVVSFTTVPLAELHRLRVFRPHRGRWDFDPYGVCIRRDWLKRLGARPVRYGDDSLWASLSPDERPFFQLLKTRRAAAGRQIDWTVEDEWRVVGDIDLAELPADAALLFVPTEADAQRMAAISRWPVTVVPNAI